MIPVFADTFYYLALANRADLFHAQAVTVARNLRAPVLTTAWIITELADALSAVHNKKVFLTMLDAIRKDPDVTILSPETPLYEDGLALFSNRLDKNWSLTDCISFVVMDRWQLTTSLTADHHFQQAGYRALLLESDVQQ